MRKIHSPPAAAAADSADAAALPAAVAPTATAEAAAGLAETAEELAKLAREMCVQLEAVLASARAASKNGARLHCRRLIEAALVLVRHHEETAIWLGDHADRKAVALRVALGGDPLP